MKTRHYISGYWYNDRTKGWEYVPIEVAADGFCLLLRDIVSKPDYIQDSRKAVFIDNGIDTAERSVMAI